MIHRFEDVEALSRRAADLFLQQAEDALAQRGRFNVALSGGRSPQRMYHLLAQPPWRERMPWASIHFFWGDERCVAADDPRSNARIVQELLLGHVPARASNVHVIRGQSAPEAEAARYHQLLHDQLPAAPPLMDLVFLGLGQDGHTASLFPHSPALNEQTHWTVVTAKQGETIRRISMTAAFINQARMVVFLVFGPDKASILKQVFQGAPDAQPLPAQLIQPTNDRLIWLLDQTAARLLPA